MNFFGVSGRYPWNAAPSAEAHVGRSVNRDTPEQIERCLHCPYPECVNCLSTRGASCGAEFDKPGRPHRFSDQTLVSLLEEGKSLREISAMLSVTVQAVRYRKRKLECKSKTK